MYSEKKSQYIPYGRQNIDDDDIDAVVAVLKSGWITTGPQVGLFEAAIAKCAQSQNAIVVNSGTAALHAAAHALGLGPGDEVLVPAITFAATANAVAYTGATPIFVDVQEEDMLIDLDDLKQKINSNTKAIFAVDFAGQPCDYHGLKTIAEQHQIAIVADSAHALGAQYQGRALAEWADMVTYSFHPVKHICAGEGGAVVTNNDLLAKKIRRFRNHGIDKDMRQRQEQGTWFYEQVELGFNYRLSDLHCALGASQIKKLPGWIDERRQIAKGYDAVLKNSAHVRMLKEHHDRLHTYHLIVVVFSQRTYRDAAYELMKENNIGVNVHYTPVHLQPYYRENYGTQKGDCPTAEFLYERILTLPVYPGLDSQDMERVCHLLNQSIESVNDFKKVV